MNTSQKIRDMQDVSRIFWLFYRWARRSGAEEAIEAVAAYRGKGAKNQSKCERKMESGHIGLADIRFAPLHEFHKKTIVCIRRILRALVRCAEKSSDVPNVYMIRGDIL